MTNKDIIVIEANGVNEIEIGDGAKLSLVKAGEGKRLSVNNKAPNEKMRWIWIAAKYLPIAKTFALGQTYPEWGEWKTKNAEAPIDVFGIGKQYLITDKSVSIKAQKAEALNKGVIFYAEAFREQPSLTHGHYIATIDEPKILSAYFARYKDEFKYPGEQGKSNVYTYKNSIRLYILGHMLPNYTVPYHNFALFEVDIYDDEGQKVTETPLQFFQKSNRSTFTINTLTELNIPIDEAWRSKSKHKENTIKTYHAQIKTTLYSNEDAVTGQPVSDVESERLITANPNPKNNNSVLKYTNKFNSVAPNNEDIVVTYTTEDEAVSKGGFWSLGRDSNRGKAHAKRYKTKIFREVFSTKDAEVLEGQQTTFQVKYNSMTVILDKYEASKTNMLTVIGDVEYSSKKVHPCKYSKLTISHKSRNTPFVLFDEDKKTKKVVDHTNLAFGILAGETQETIKILAEGLNIQDYHPDHKNPPICHGITTARVRLKNFMLKDKPKRHTNQEDFKHNTIKDVFSMEKAYALYPNSTFGILPKEFDKSVPGDESIDISKQAVDFEYLDSANEKGIALKVGYLYNKTYDTRAEKWLGNTLGEFTNDLLDIAWVCRYFVFMKNVKQTYMVPISTCRYPNQLAKIEVFPDFEWWINLKYNYENSLYVHENPKYKHRVFTTTKKQTNKKLKAHKTKKSKQSDWSHKLDIDVGYKVNGSTNTQWSLGDGFSFMKTINFILYAFEIMEDLFLTKEVKKISEKGRPLEELISIGEAVKDAQSVSVSNGKLLKPGEKPDYKATMERRAGIRKTKDLPVSFSLARPSFAAGVHFKYERSKNNPQVMDYFFKVKGKAEPLTTLTGRLDLLYFAQFLGPVGVMIGRINSVFSGINFFTCGAVEVDYELDLIGKLAANISLSGNYHGTDGIGIDINANLPVTLGITVGGSLKYDFGTVEGMAAIEANAMADFDIVVLEDKRNEKYGGSLYFKGLKAVFTLKFSRKEDKSERTPKKMSKLEKSGRDNESKQKEIIIMDPSKEPLKFNFFD